MEIQEAVQLRNYTECSVYKTISFVTAYHYQIEPAFSLSDNRSLPPETSDH